MKRYARIILLLGTALVLSGCQTGKKAEDTAGKEAKVTQAQEEKKDPKQGTELPKKEDSTYTWKEITITIPSEWKNLYTVVENEQGFYILQKSSNERQQDLGMLCGFCRSSQPIYNMPGVQPLAYTKDNMYLLTTPTRVSYYYQDQHISDEYAKMAQYLDQIAQSVKIDADQVVYHADEFTCPMSEYYALDEDTLQYLSDNQLRLAQMEIYARHGCRFEDDYTQSCFDRCSWYQPETDLAEFDENQLTDKEKASLNTLKEKEEKYNKEHPYPKKYETSKTVKVDLDCDKKKEEIIYQADQTEQSFTINGKEYKLEDYGAALENPITDRFYIADIASYTPGLEIAVMAEGPSDDPETFFFQYDGELHYIGSVTGFPFREESGINGFDRDGCVKGNVRLDIIHTCYGDGYWNYNSARRALEYQETELLPLKPGDVHKLLTDVTVYQAMNLTSIKSTIKACDQVYFIASDGAEWIQIQTKDGQKGFVHIEDGRIDEKEAGEVFSDLVLCD